MGAYDDNRLRHNHLRSIGVYPGVRLRTTKTGESYRDGYRLAIMQGGQRCRGAVLEADEGHLGR